MKKVIIWAIVTISIVGGLVWLGRLNANTDTPVLTFAKIQQEVAKGAKFYDVRTKDEYMAGHFVGAVNWSLQQMQAGALPDVAKDTEIFVHCHSGNRSGQATALLRSAGYTNVTDLHGITDVEATGGKLVTNT